jgi:hypothetical protein
VSSIRAATVTDWSVYLKLSAVAAHIAVQWQLDLESGDFSTPKVDTGWDTSHLTSIWLTDMPVHTAHKARAKLRFADLSESAWIGPAHFTTRRLAALGTSLFLDENEGTDPTIIGEYGHGSGVGFVTPDFPELVVELEDGFGLRNDTGFRSRMAKQIGVYDQSSLPTALSHAVRYSDSILVDPSKSVTMMFVLVPEKPNLGVPYGSTIAGGENASWWLYEYNGTLGGMRGRDGLLSNPLEYASGGALNIGEPNLVIIRYKKTVWHLDTNCPAMPVIDEPLVYDIWLNGAKNTSADPAARDGFGAYGNCTVGGVGHTNFYLPTLDLQVPIYVGTCTSGPQGETAGGNHGYAGIVSEFMWNPAFLITDAQADGLYAAFSTGDMDQFSTLVKALAPLVYDRYAQPKRPEKPTVTIS